jgi:hypothetical protein
MKPPLFHVGQAVVCIENEWEDCDGAPPSRPVKGSIHIVEDVQWDVDNWYLSFPAFPINHFEQDAFAPAELLPDATLAELLEETLAPVTA